jgi:hypothetical protein
MSQVFLQFRTRWICLILLFGLLTIKNTNAANWDIEPTLTVGAAYTSNVFLAPDGFEESDLIGQVNPGINIHGEGSRSRFDLEYVMENLFYQDHPDGNNTYNHLRFFNTNDLTDEVLHLDLSAIFDQTTIDNSGRVGVGNFAINLNRADYFSYGASPYLTFSLGSNAYTEIRYRYNKINYTEPYDLSLPVGLVDNESNIFSFLAGSRGPQRLGWTLTYFNNTTDFDTGTQTRFQRGLLDLVHDTSAYIKLLAGAGYEDNTYATESPNPTEGAIWYLGFQWIPNSRTNLEIRAGERYFGPSQSVSFSYTARRTTITLGYTQDFRTIATAQDSAQAATPPPDAPIETTTTQLTDDVYLSKRLLALIEYTGTRSNASISIYNNNDEYQSSGQQQELTGMNVSWSRNLTRRTTLTLGGIYQYRTFFTIDRNDTTKNANITLTRYLQRDVTGNIAIYHTNRDSNDPLAKYTENIANLFVNIKF